MTRGNLNVAVPLSTSIEERVRQHPWQDAVAELEAAGCTVLPQLLDAEECSALRGMCSAQSLFRSRVVMARHNFGRGEYQYFAYPLRRPIASHAAAAALWKGERYTLGMIFHDAA